MEAPFDTPHELVRPWRRATLIASSIAAIELVLLIAAAAALLAKPLSHSIQRHAESAAVAHPKHVAAAKPTPHLHRTTAPPAVAPAIPRARLRILVLNGNGRSGAAAGEAGRLERLGYKVAGTANARRQDYATSVVMYRHGFRAEGFRLARDLKVKVVGPLDGIPTSSLQGGQLAVVVGA